MSTWKDYFTFDKRQRNGVIILLFLIVSVVGIKLSLPLFFTTSEEYNSDFEERIKAFEASVVTAQKTENFKASKQKLYLFNFNPNHLSKEKWRLLGLKDWQIKTLHNYEAKGGSFKTKLDVKKIYGLSEELYDKLEPYIQIVVADKVKVEEEKITLFQFNPNNLPEAKWKMLGLKDWQIKIIYNYESKGGTFKIKKDVSKIYGIKPELYEKWEPYIVIPGDGMVVKVQLTSTSKLVELTSKNFKGLENISYFKEHGFYKYTIGELHSEKEAKQMLAKAKKAGFDSAFLIAFNEGKKVAVKTAFNTKSTKEWKKIKVEKIELNTADSVALISIRGIGPTYAKRILKYKARLGGYLNLRQLQEVYGITVDNYAKIAMQLKLDTTKINKININECKWGRLVSHPYISKNVANSLINYRKNHGHFSKRQEVQYSDLVNEELYRKIAPYLKTE